LEVSVNSRHGVQVIANCFIFQRWLTEQRQQCPHCRWVSFYWVWNSWRISFCS